MRRKGLNWILLYVDNYSKINSKTSLPSICFGGMGTQLRKVWLTFPMHRRGGEAVEAEAIAKTFVACAAEHKSLPKADLNIKSI